MKTTEWICDTCGEKITDVEHGWVEWLQDEGTGKVRHGLRLVHAYGRSPHGPQGRCQYSNDVNGLSDSLMQEYVGPDGLVELLSMLTEEPWMFKDPEEVLTMIQRLHVPGYEKAFRHFKAAIADGVFEPNTKAGYHSQRDIQAVNDWLDSREE